MVNSPFLSIWKAMMSQAGGASPSSSITPYPPKSDKSRYRIGTGPFFTVLMAANTHTHTQRLLILNLNC